jgi:hypothetical protein
MRKIKMTPELLKLRNKYMALQHSMQCGVKYSQESGAEPETSKDTRVGINTAMSDHGALVDLLVRKGVITDEEIAEAMIDYMQQEVDRYRDKLKLVYGADINLI